MKTLYLHIGHSKTGTSFIQSCLANSAQALKKAGIEYYRGDEGTALDWKISSGNGNMLINGEIESFKFSQDKVLFSGEQLFLHISKMPDFRTKLKEFCTAHGFENVRMLLFIRDPLPHAESSYQQMIKRGGQTFTPNKAFANYKNPLWAEKLLTSPPDLPNLVIDVFNYDRHKRDLMPIVSRFLGVADGTIPEVTARQVNRSMTEAERTMQRAVNQYLGNTGGFISDALCNLAPDVKSERAYPPYPAQKKMLDRLGGAISAVNAIVPESERYQLDLQKPTRKAANLQFSREQIDIIGQAVGENTVAIQTELYATRFQLYCAMAELKIGESNLPQALDLLLRAERQLSLLEDRKHDKANLASMRHYMNNLKHRAG